MTKDSSTPEMGWFADSSQILKLIGIFFSNPSNKCDHQEKKINLINS